MNTGMLWFDNDPKADLNNKIQRAVDYYSKKYGQAPNLCFVHPSMLGKETLTSTKMEIKPSRSVLPHHFWIGVHTT